MDEFFSHILLVAISSMLLSLKYSIKRSVTGSLEELSNIDTVGTIGTGHMER